MEECCDEMLPFVESNEIWTIIDWFESEYDTHCDDDCRDDDGDDVDGIHGRDCDPRDGDHKPYGSTPVNEVHDLVCFYLICKSVFTQRTNLFLPNPKFCFYLICKSVLTQRTNLFLPNLQIYFYLICKSVFTQRTNLFLPNLQFCSFIILSWFSFIQCFVINNIFQLHKSYWGELALQTNTESY